MYCQIAKFFYLKLDRDHEMDYIFGVNPNLIRHGNRNIIFNVFSKML